MPYTITEPHPTVRKNTYTHSGRGGAGNHFLAPATTSPSGVPTRGSNQRPSISNPTTPFSSGRGGAGNIMPSAVRTAFSFDEELERAKSRDMHPTYTCGRGGAGNFKAAVDAVRRGSDASRGSTNSNASDNSLRSGFWGRLSSSLNRN